MIKQLIEDITFDRIALSQALTRAKIIAYKISNAQFKDWITSELNGYSDHTKLPSYRIIPCDIFAEMANPFRGNYTIPFDVSALDNDLKSNGKLSLYEMNVTQSIPTLEEGTLNNKNEFYGYEYLPQGLINLLRGMVGGEDGSMITSVKRRIQLSQIKHIVSTTKQRLLDTLLELNDAFPNLVDEYKNDSHNESKAQTIINQHIYGDYSNSNIGVGENVIQTIETSNKLEKLIDEIKSLGIDESDANEVKEIILHEKKENVGKKIMSWIGKMASKAIEKGIELQIPVLIEKVSEFI